MKFLFADDPFLEKDYSEAERLWLAVWDEEEEHTVSLEPYNLIGIWRGLTAAGGDADLIYAHVLYASIDDPDYQPAIEPQELEEYAAYRVGLNDLIAPPGDAFLSIGFDVSVVVPYFHSYLFQPELNDAVPNLPRLLNKHGLLPTYADAMKLLRHMLQSRRGARVWPPAIVEIFRYSESN